MNTNQDRNASLPIRRNLTLIYALSFIIAILMAAASIAGLLYQRITYQSDDLLQSFPPTDVSILFIGLPMLLGSMWLRKAWGHIFVVGLCPTTEGECALQRPC